jgi:hypothetical protein
MLFTRHLRRFALLSQVTFLSVIQQTLLGEDLQLEPQRSRPPSTLEAQQSTQIWYHLHRELKPHRS